MAAGSATATDGEAWERSGRMVVPAWPPMTGTFMSETATPPASATKVLARTMSRVVTPMIFLGS